jgi:glycosyltransferase involved in cell wall biosynthesis
MLTQARYAADAGISSHVLSLAPPTPTGLRLASQNRVPVAENDDVPALFGWADIVNVHFWNSPELYALLRDPLPPARLLLTMHVAGDTWPHLMTRALWDFADRVIVTSPYIFQTAFFRSETWAQKAALVWSTADPARVQDVLPRPHSGVSIGYIGTVDFLKLHPEFVSLCARVRVPEARFIVCGSGRAYKTLRREADSLAAPARFEWRGETEDIAVVLSGLDVFGYPLAPDNYSTAELALQEAMWARVPPVILGHGGATGTVTHGETGLTASTTGEYISFIEQLAADEALRRRLGEQAREFARVNFHPGVVVSELCRQYELLVEEPCRAREWPRPVRRVSEGADAFLNAVGESGAPLYDAVLAGDSDAADADEVILAQGALLANGAGGGLLDYARYYPHDAWLAFWAGLALQGAGRPALAASCYRRAAQLAGGPKRAGRYLDNLLARV